MLDKECSVRVKEICSEPKYNQAGFGHFARRRIVNAPMIGLMSHDHSRVGAIAAADVVQQRKNHGQDDALLNPEQDNCESCDERNGELPGLGTANLGKAAQV